MKSQQSHRGTLTLKFADAPPRLSSIEFRAPGSSEPTKTPEIRADGAVVASLTWSQGSMGMGLFFIKYKQWSAGNKKSGFSFAVKAPRSPEGSFAIALLAPSWITKVFSTPNRTKNFIDQVFQHQNLSGKSKRTDRIIRVSQTFLPPEAVTILWNETKIGAARLDELAKEIEDQWRPHRKDASVHLPNPTQPIQNAGKKVTPAKAALRTGAAPPVSERQESGTAAPDPTVEDQKCRVMTSAEFVPEGIDKRTLEQSIIKSGIIRDPRVLADFVRQFRGEVLRCYVYMTLPDTNPPEQYVIDEWLGPEAASALATRLMDELPEGIVRLFRNDEWELRDWAKQRLAAAIWSDDELRERLLSGIAMAGLPVVRAWVKHCAAVFPLEATRQLLDHVVAVLSDERQAVRWRQDAVPVLLQLLKALPEERRHDPVSALADLCFRRRAEDLLWLKEHGREAQVRELVQMSREAGLSSQDLPDWLSSNF